MHVAILGAGLMGSQIGVEYALGGHSVVFVSRSRERAARRVRDAISLAVESGLASAEAGRAAQDGIAVETEPGAIGGDCRLVVETVVEDLAVKGEVLAEVAAVAPEAILATNTSSLSILAIGEACRAPERVVGTHYWNPPLLMPLVEVVRSERTRPGIAEEITATLLKLGKRPVLVEKDAPGFVWNRLQLALLREAIWIVEHGVASPETVDEVVRDGLARRWRYTGPFQTAALGGAATFEKIAANLWPGLSAATELRDLRRWLPGEADDLGELRERRDRGLRRDLGGELATRNGHDGAVLENETGGEAVRAEEVGRATAGGGA
ncbi:MAG: 3-hydroxyacyl-CoA dehydrogenase family protein [Chloroflexia bacterium]|nr:3-hydroxyacyl-CoA dehydrogenase family protein [Chloroflexia bacterium]